MNSTPDTDNSNSNLKDSIPNNSYSRSSSRSPFQRSIIQQLPPVIPPVPSRIQQSSSQPFITSPSPQLSNPLPQLQLRPLQSHQNQNQNEQHFHPFDRLSVSNLVSPQNVSSVNTPIPDSDDDIIDFYKNNYGEPTMLGQGIFTWVTFLKKDPYARAVVLSSKKDKVVFTNMKNGKKSAFTDKFYNELDINENEGGSKIITNQKAKNKDLLNSLKKILSDRKLVWILIHKFFESELIAVFPLLDKDDFIMEVSEIISHDSPSTYFNFLKRINFATIGTLLLVMRLASLTSYNAGRNSSKPRSTDDLYIKDHPITKDVLTLVHLCFDEVMRFKDAHLITFQFNLLMVHYKFYGPEDCDCIGRSSATSNMGPLLHSAVALGLNRDPKISHPKYKNPELLRRLWYLVVYLDYYQTMLVGNSPMINNNSYDVELPKLDHNASALTYVIHESFHERNKLSNICEPLFTRIMNVNNQPKIREVLMLMKPVEEYIESSLRPEEIIKISSDSVMNRVSKLKIQNVLADSFSVLFMMHYHLFLHYSASGNSERSLYYCLKLLNLCNCLLPAMFHFKDDPNKSDNDSNEQQQKQKDLNSEFGSSILALPKIELTLHKISEFMMALLARVKTFKLFAHDKLNIDDETLQIVDNIGSLLFKTVFFLLECFTDISDTYYHSWCMTKIQSFIIEKVLKNKRGKMNFDKIDPLEKGYSEKIKPLIKEDEGFFLYSKQDLQQILQELEIIDLSSLGQSPTPERLFYHLNSNNIKNDQLWLDQLFDGNFNPDQFQPFSHNHQNHQNHDVHSSNHKYPEDVSISSDNGLEMNNNNNLPNTNKNINRDNNGNNSGNLDDDSNTIPNSIAFDYGMFDLEQMLFRSTNDF
ncbi:hypothetical protein BN7_1977 [Wickerhamomyces ciferrii]|uniref:Xylanolytic transcriptional activator regulatory domain-containing protein n=1 Tax=Wickerhamomyces ciferrii (strain ATCC 14091 / BCRC 22168 / CBS 111 / JCM 3599 / NBRC 0793 / NRRL Y-1031 F-60-10) TaxID=1206466 RepID=K0KJV5_WICCF|nr:uncharacterized protein BN7_1977 [Wickerhamomyces ciferrii]CCH42432.1 hypothetical protein BN7_1977 [Wickerhamomyces ciferrii]